MGRTCLTGEKAETLFLSSLLISLSITLLSLKSFNNGSKNHQGDEYNTENVFEKHHLRKTEPWALGNQLPFLLCSQPYF